MFGIGTTELVIFLIIILVLFGGRLPTIARSLGKSITEFKKGVHGIEEDVSTPEGQQTKTGTKSES